VWFIGSPVDDPDRAKNRDMSANAVLGRRSYIPRAYTTTPVPTARERHMMNRMGSGSTPATLTQLRNAGGPEAWFEAQLHPGGIQESAKVADINTWFPDRNDSMPDRFAKSQADTKTGHEYGAEFGCWTLLRRMFSTRTVLENMVDLWSNHFHVPPFADQAWLGRQQYDTVIRTHALGRFDQMLAAVSLQSSMLLYLDNSKSLRDAPNENHGRELLELHTVGPDSGYTEDMVKDSAKILSGWTTHSPGSFAAYYNTEVHTMGAVRVLGFSHPNATADGRTMTAAYLRYLAHHPSTARTVARKLAVRFVSDNPSEALIADLAGVFLASGTDIRATMRALVASDEFLASAGSKARTPYDDVVATVRVLKINPLQPRQKSSFARAIAHAHGADPLFSWPRPDGAPQSNAPWCSASRMLASYLFHWAMSGSYYPSDEVVFRTPASFLPQPSIRLDAFVDHLCRVMIGRASTPLLLQAACEAVEFDPAEVINRDHRVIQYLFNRLLGALLDSPEHMAR
jgi:hypothetical protein